MKTDPKDIRAIMAAICYVAEGSSIAQAVSVADALLAELERTAKKEKK